MHRKPEAWETNAPGAFLTIGEVAVWALGEQRFRLVSPSGEEEVEGFEDARGRARELAGLAWSRPGSRRPIPACDGEAEALAAAATQE